jgi:hypoxanthine phosphoribosyltransferase
METLLTADAIRHRTRELGEAITRDYRDADLVIVGVLKGCFVFLADLTRHIGVPHEVDFIWVSSYGEGASSSGVVRLLKDLDTDISGRDVLLVEDIVDTGNSLVYIKENLETRAPRSLRICSLLDKRERRERVVPVAYVGFEIPNRFVVGYGLDYAERFRGLPYVGIHAAGGEPA